MGDEIVRFAKPTPDRDSLTEASLRLSTEEKNSSSASVAADPSHKVAVSVYVLPTVTVAQAYATYACVGGRRPRSAWKVSIDKLRAIAERHGQQPDFISVQHEPIPGPCGETPGAEGHGGLFGLTSHEKNDKDLRRLMRAMRAEAVREFEYVGDYDEVCESG